VSDHGSHIPALSLALGLDTKILSSLLAEKLKTNTDRIFERVNLRRIHVERHAASDRPRVTAANLTTNDVRIAVVSGGHYLADGVSPDGHFRYEVNAAADPDVPGYD